MIIRKKPLILTAIFVAIASFAVPTSLVSAQSGSGQALEIGPPVITLSGNPGETVETTISLRDISSTDLYVSAQVNDFEANGEDGTPKVILDEDVTTPYSFKEWLRPIAPLVLEPREIRSLKVYIDIPDSASPGGYYGIVRFTGVPPELEGTGVSLNASLGSLIFLKVNGEANEELALEEFSASSGGITSWILEGTPITFTQRIKNTGNTFEQPVGLITVKDMFGKTIATIPVNEEQRLIIGNSTRKFEQTLDSSILGDKILFGKYTAEFTMSYGTSSTELTDTMSFWVIPYKLIGMGIILLIVLFFALRFLIRRYNRLIVHRATGVSPKKRRRRK
jgi:hypothetical protein